MKLLEIEIDRKHFTRHGQHLNLYDKEISSVQLAMIIGNSIEGIN
jgi:hypothetical protein